MTPIYKKIELTERPFVLHIFMGQDHEAITKKLNRRKNKLKPIQSDFFKQDSNNDAVLFDITDHLPGHFVMVFYHLPPPSTIAHEAFHCTAQHFRYIGQPLDENSEESYAYMIDWLTSTIMKTLKL